MTRRRHRLALGAVFACAVLGGCSLFVSSEGYVGEPDASAAFSDDATPTPTPSDDGAVNADGATTADARPDAPTDAGVDAAPPCETTKQFTDDFERDVPGGQGWSFVDAPVASSTLAISSTYATSPTRSLMVKATAIDSGIAYTSELTRLLSAPCLDLTFSIRSPTQPKDLRLLQLATIGGTQYPLLIGTIEGNALELRETSSSTPRLIASVGLTAGAFTKIHIRWTGKPTLLVEADGFEVPLRTPPIYKFGALDAFELGITVRSKATSGTVYVDDVAIR